MTLRELRLERQLTQRDMAAILGVTEKSIQRWENGITVPRKWQRQALAKRFGVPVDELEFG